MTSTTPTKLIYGAIRRSGYQVRAPMEKVIQYQEHPYKGRSDEIEPLKFEPAVGVCWLCGDDLNGRGVSLGHAIKDTFTDHDLARAPWSGHICEDCAWCLSWKYLRNYSIISNECMIVHPDKAQIRSMLLNPPEPPFIFIIAVSGQKWLHFKSPVNYCDDGYIAMLEESPITVDRAMLGTLIEVVTPLLAVFSKAEVLSGSYSQSRVQKFGLKQWQEVEKKIAAHRGSGLFDLSLYVSQKEEG